MAPFEYTSLIWAFCLSYLIWGDIPKAQVFLGAGLIILSGMFVVFGEWQARRRQPVAPQPGARQRERGGRSQDGKVAGSGRPPDRRGLHGGGGVVPIHWFFTAS